MCSQSGAVGNTLCYGRGVGAARAARIEIWVTAGPGARKLPECIQTLGQFKHLRVLDISGCIEITDCGIRELPVTLQALDLSQSGITITGMRSLTRLDCYD